MKQLWYLTSEMWMSITNFQLLFRGWRWREHSIRRICGVLVLVLLHWTTHSSSRSSSSFSWWVSILFCRFRLFFSFLEKHNVNVKSRHSYVFFFRFIHGFVGNSLATKWIVDLKKENTFVIRFSTSRPGCLVITCTFSLSPNYSQEQKEKECVCVCEQWICILIRSFGCFCVLKVFITQSPLIFLFKWMTNKALFSAIWNVLSLSLSFFVHFSVPSCPFYFHFVDTDCLLNFRCHIAWVVVKEQSRCTSIRLSKRCNQQSKIWKSMERSGMIE